MPALQTRLISYFILCSTKRCQILTPQLALAEEHSKFPPSAYLKESAHPSISTRGDTATRNPSFSTIRNVRLSLTLKVGTYGNEDGALPNIIGMSVSDLTNAVEKFHWLAILTMLLLSPTYHGPVCNVTPGC
ncbi:hypothetical protein EDB19DRAFT_1824122 [Suillus lakei]|nr:hypothetical protein EDB19DRAFT_1824122 [Suillus lakei]